MFHLLRISLLQTREKKKLYPLFVENVHVTFKAKAQGRMRFSLILKNGVIFLNGMNSWFQKAISYPIVEKTCQETIDYRRSIPPFVQTPPYARVYR